jgi:hypothetical protein
MLNTLYLVGDVNDNFASVTQGRCGILQYGLRSGRHTISVWPCAGGARVYFGQHGTGQAFHVWIEMNDL